MAGSSKEAHSPGLLGDRREGPMNRTLVTILKVLLILWAGYMVIMLIPLLSGSGVSTSGGT